jgi:hypothetical protein
VCVCVCVCVECVFRLQSVRCMCFMIVVMCVCGDECVHKCVLRSQSCVCVSNNCYDHNHVCACVCVRVCVCRMCVVIKVMYVCWICGKVKLFMHRVKFKAF